MKTMSINKKNILDNNKTAIHYAILQNEWKIVTKLIDFGANVNICDKSGQCAVDLICLSHSLNDFVLFKRIFSKFDGDALTKRDENGQSMLHLICSNGTDKINIFDRINFYV